MRGKSICSALLITLGARKQKNHHVLAEMTSRDAFAPLLFIHVFKKD